MIEGSSLAAVRAAGDRLESQLVPLMGGEPIDRAIYQLEHAYSNHSANGSVE
jgi:hypothetical protein